ncbi:hypothetical protein L0665_02890 [Methanogenium marinum]|uniref:DUF7847 domain-containing protein n=1 Tax=Methanogenium marinum TaxID=348610 RepID=A0A9Q4KS49_9EURY|nr:hypothetical protein [Methanogenium marinum]MDE4907559.1 hypothetical protein [Methanogenium marinum]
MVFQSLKEAFRCILRYPLILLSGVWVGCSVAALEYCVFNGLNFYAETIGFFAIIIFPFFVGSSYEMIYREDGALSAFWTGGISRYFAVLLPGVFVTFIGSVAAFILTIILAAIGGGQDDMLMIMGVFWIFIPIVFFFFFYDTAVVLEDKKVFASLLRSLQFVRSRPFEVIAFYCACFILLIVLFIASAFIGSVFLAGSMVFDPSLDVNTLLNMTVEEQQALIGEDGLSLIIALYAVVAGIFTAILLPLKAVFYQRHVQGISEEKQEEEIQEAENKGGVYDEKGRWYKY